MNFLKLSQGVVDGRGFHSRLSGMSGLVASWEYGKAPQLKTFLTGFITNTSGTNVTVSTTAASNTVTGSGTSFTTTFTLGDQIVITGGDTLTIQSIASDTSLTTTTNATATVSGATFKKQTIKCSYLPDVSGNGYHASQYNFQSQPIWTPSGLIFASPNFLEVLPTTGFLNNASGFTIIGVGIPGTGASDKTFMACSQSGTTNNNRCRLSIAGSSSNKLRAKCKPQATSTADTDQLGTTGVTTGVKGIFVVTYDCATDTLKFYRNGVLDTTTTTAYGSTSNIPNADPKTIHLGSDQTLAAPATAASFFSNGQSSNVAYWQEVHVFNRALSATEAAAV